MKLKFMKEFLLNPRDIGAITISSKYLAKKMIEHIDYENCSCIVEYGAGTGVFTEEIIRLKKEDTILIVIELNEKLYNLLKNKFKANTNVVVVNDDVQNLRNILKENNITEIDHVISGLPFTSLPKNVGENILKETKKYLKETGEFTTFQYSLIRKDFFKNHFKISNISREFRNIPPAYVLNLKK